MEILEFEDYSDKEFKEIARAVSILDTYSLFVSEDIAYTIKKELDRRKIEI